MFRDILFYTTLPLQKMKKEDSFSTPFSVFCDNTSPLSSLFLHPVRLQRTVPYLLGLMLLYAKIVEITFILENENHKKCQDATFRSCLFAYNTLESIAK